jgi:hypothetical protein
MVACEWVDLLGAVVDLFDRGNIAEARRLHAAALSGINLETAYGMAGAGEVLRRRGIVRSATSRYANDAALDGHALAEIEATMQFLTPEVRWPDRSARS